MRENSKKKKKARKKRKLKLGERDEKPLSLI